MSIDPERIPVIVGVGEYLDRPENPDNGLDSRGLMKKALEAADADAGGGWLADIESLATVDQISWPQLGKIAAPLAASINAKPKILFTTDHANGDSPILLLNEAANLIGEGKVKVAAIVGGEALRTAAHFAKKAAAEGKPQDTSVAALSASMSPPYRRRYGLNGPVDVYPLYENAGRSAYGQTLAEGQAESGEIWSRFAAIAKETDGAWLRKGATSEEIQTPTPNNRPISHPYNKLMVANSSVNQGAGYIVTSLAEAERRGVDKKQLIYIGLGASAHEDDEPLRRDRYDRSASMTVSISRAMSLNGLKADDLDFVELYSCFPCVPKMARRVLDWPLDRPATVFGGLTFGGGPIGNYMAHAVVNMVKKLRQQGSYGFLFANGGFATHNHSIVLSNQPMAHAQFPQDFNYQAEADRARERVPQIDEIYEGPAKIETYTVLYDREGKARHGVIVARTPDGARTLAKVPAQDERGIAFLTDGKLDPVNTDGYIVGIENGDYIWRRD
jgi:acetyl-CoA C-acetyltransferase